MIPALARAQAACPNSSNVVVVAGTSAFDAIVSKYVLAATSASPPTTFVYQGFSSPLQDSCVAAMSVATAKDLGGTYGRYYTASGGTLLSNDCLFAAGQTVDLALSEVFYETCANAPQPRPADVTDTIGPVQPAMLVVPKSNATIQYVTYEELRTLYGCGISSANPVAGFFGEPMDVWCRSPAIAGAQVAVARSLGLTESTLAASCGNQFPSDAILARALTPIPMTDPSNPPYNPPGDTIAFLGAPDFKPTDINHLAFRAAGQGQAFFPDSSQNSTDRANVRNGHYPLWGYAHLIAKATTGQAKVAVSDMIAWINGLKTIPNLDHAQLEAGVGMIPLCAMKVQRSADGGLLRPYTAPESCSCAFEAVSTRAIPSGCVPCPSPSVCGCGMACRHGFCE